MPMPKEVIDIQTRRNRELTTQAEVFEWTPEYPTPRSAEYRNSFIRGAGAAGLRDIPANVLSWAIDRAITAKTPPVTAGRVFADCYFKLQMRPDFLDKQRREGVQNRAAYLLAVYEQELKGKSNGV